ncbi:MAG TPA: sigma-70 family RNA polymerase sigma factor, partial [Roseiflexaceae bacterium]|nr:sigma-70 family RNA polymerase sigma factor [Roseiflexaceae bacterium]
MKDLESLVILAQAPSASLARRHDAFGELVVRFQNMVFGYAYAILGDSYLAQEAAQKAFITAYQHMHELRAPGAFPGWLRRIVLTQSNRLVRGKRIAPQSIEMVAQLSAEQSDVAAAIERQELAEQLHTAIRALPEQQRAAVILYYIDGYSQHEVAAFLELSVDAVKKQLQRARERLQERMLAMVRDDLRKRRPSKDNRFVQAVRLFSSLQAAAEESELTTIELMLVDGVDIDAQNEAGHTLLHWAAQ